MDAPDPYAALRTSNFRLYILSRLIFFMGAQMQAVALSWQLYQETRSPKVLALMGLIQAIPIFVFTLPAGYCADRFNRRNMVNMVLLVQGACAISLSLLFFYHGSYYLIYAILFILASARTFGMPASASLLPQIIPENLFPNAVTWNSTVFELSSIVGPAAAGFLIAWFGCTTTFVIQGAACLCAVMLLVQIKLNSTPPPREPVTLNSLGAGIKFVWNAKILLSALTLDLFAVLFGGIITLLPIFATDILHVGPTGMGWLQASPAIGAFLMVILQTHSQPFKRAGQALMLSTAGFGIATICFALSSNLYLSMAMLILIGACDNVSVIFRHTMIQILPPDHMRGRVNSVNSFFIGLSNDLNKFLSGRLTHLLGSPVSAAIVGGLGTLAVVAWVAIVWPELRKVKSLHRPLDES